MGIEQPLTAIHERFASEGRNFWTGFMHVPFTTVASIQHSLLFAQSNKYVWHEVVPRRPRRRSSGSTARTRWPKDEERVVRLLEDPMSVGNISDASARSIEEAPRRHAAAPAPPFFGCHAKPNGVRYETIDQSLNVVDRKTVERLVYLFRANS